MTRDTAIALVVLHARESVRHDLVTVGLIDAVRALDALDADEVLSSMGAELARMLAAAAAEDDQ